LIPDGPTYAIEKTKEKGMGMFAKRALKAGELILAERPVLVTPQHVAFPIPPHEQEKIILKLRKPNGIYFDFPCGAYSCH
jgi:hypothetical protein